MELKPGLMTLVCLRSWLRLVRLAQQVTLQYNAEFNVYILNWNCGLAHDISNYWNALLSFNPRYKKDQEVMALLLEKTYYHLNGMLRAVVKYANTNKNNNNVTPFQLYRRRRGVP